MLAWRHSGFSVHNGVRVRAGDAEGRKKLAQYMLRAPLRSVAVQAAEDGQLVAARATGARKGHRRIKTAGARTDLPSRSRHRLSC